MAADGDFLDDLFLGCPLAAFVEQARAERGWPDREATRRRAYRLYEDALAEKNGRTGRSRSTAAQNRVTAPPNPTSTEEV
jgi:hypothetical protein